MVFKLRRREAGAHIDLTVFVAPAPDQTFANIGVLIGRAAEIDRLIELLQRAAPESVVVDGSR